MRMRKAPLAAITLVASSIASSVLIGACGEEPPVKDPSSVSPTSAKSSGDGSGKSGGSESTAAPAEIKCVGKPDVGKPASTFSLGAVNGGGKTGIEKGKVTIVDFWATWCEPCKKSFPKYQELYVKYKASGLEIVAVSVDDADTKKDIPGFITTHGAKFPVGWDDGHKIAECYKPPNMPSAYVIDKNGVIKHVHNGYHEGEEKELEKEIKALL